jgi:hypothetical protein
MSEPCVEIEQALAAGQELTPAQREHAARCAPCASLVRRLAVVEKLLAAPGTTPPWFTERTLARIRRRRLAEAFLHEPFPWRLVVPATALSLAALGFWTFLGIPSVHVRPLVADWAEGTHHVRLIGQLVRDGLPALAAVALSILPFLLPATRARSRISRAFR